MRALFAWLKPRGFSWWQGLLAIPPEPTWEVWWQSRLLDREASIAQTGEPFGTQSPNRLMRKQGKERLPSEVARSDADLIAEMQRRIERAPWISNRDIWIDAKDGVIALTGLVVSAEERAALGTMARAIAGCKGVENHLLPREKFPRACA